MSSIQLLSCSPQEPRALVDRLNAHGFEVSVGALSAEPDSEPTASDVRLFVATGDRLTAGELEKLARCLAASHETPSVLLANQRPTAAQSARLLSAGLDLLVGSGALAHLEAQLEALIRRSRRSRPAGGFDQKFHLGALRSRFDFDALGDAALKEQGLAAARCDAPLIVHGEGGSGRRFLAATVHSASARAAQPFVDHEFVADADEQVRALQGANGGTLVCRFLDPLSAAQCELLLACLAQQVSDVRLVLRVPPRARSGAEGLRQISRLERLLEARVIEVRPLRHRPEAVGHLVRRITGLAPDSGALQALRAHPWPGNIGELIAVLEYVRERVQGDSIRLEHLPPALRVQRDASSGQGILERVPTPSDWTITEADPIDLAYYEHKCILRAIGLSGGSRVQAATLLGLGKSTLYRKLREYLPPDQAREEESA